MSDFDDLTDIYEAMIDWPKRLATEGPFYRRLFEQAGVRRVADVACGTGRHAALFHSWGLEVLGLDISPSMVERARRQFGEPAGLRWGVQDFRRPVLAPDALDAVVCLGNSLSLAGDVAAAGQALAAMLRSVRPGGLVIVHVLNLYKIPPGPCLWQKCLKTTLGERELVVLKGVHRCGDVGRVELVVIPPQAGEFRAHSVPFTGLKPEDLARAARDLAASAAFYGSVKGEPFDPARSTDLILVATRGG